MVNIIPQITIAAALLFIITLIMLCYAKPRKDQSDFIIGLLNKLGEEETRDERSVCGKKRGY
ncbi:MAG: hypothetical protein WC779_00645 [Candidatus Omnitrophota bacterium]|jgi:preprotein translocase subunit SecG